MIKSFIKNEISGWKAWEIIWLMLSTVVLLAVSIAYKQSFIVILSCIFGAWAVIFTGKGKLSSFLFALVHVVMYSIIAAQSKYYGETILNLFFYVPMNVIGLFSWKKNMNEEKKEVSVQKMSLGKFGILFILAAVVSAGYSLVLKAMGGNLPFINAVCTVVAIIGQILCNKRYAEQWYMWVLGNSVSLSMWAIEFVKYGTNLPTMIMWIVFVLNSIFMLIKWQKSAREQN